MFSWKSFATIGILWVSAANAQMADNIANMDMITSAKLCATAQGMRSYYSYNPIKFDPESVLIEKVKLAPVKMEVLKNYDQSLQLANKASDNMDSCLEKNRKEIEAFSWGAQEGWSKGIHDSKFGKGRLFTKARSVDKSDKHLMSDDVYNQIKKINAKTENKSTRISSYIYLSEKEIVLLKQHSEGCAVRNTKNQKSCDEKATSIAKRLFPNFVYTSYTESAHANYMNTKFTDLRNKICGQEVAALVKAEKDLNDKEVKALATLQSFGLDIDWLDRTKISALRDLLANKAQLLKFTYKPSSEKLKKLNSDMDSSDENAAHHALILKRAANKSKILLYNPIRYEQGKLQGYLGADINSVGSGSMHDQCEEEDIKAAYKSWMKTIGSSVGSAVK